MAVKRLASITPDLNTVTQLVESDITAVASITVTNTISTPATVTIYVRPFNDLGNDKKYSYLAANLPIDNGQVFETFRFGVNVGDIIEVSASTSGVNFTANAVYETQGGAQVFYQATAPAFPQVGEIWVNSDDNQVSLWTGSSWNYIAINAPTGPTGETGATGPDGPQGETGPVGPTGPQGVSFNLKGEVADIASLPVVENSIDDGYYVIAESEVYVYTASGFVSVGPVFGPTGPTGAAGTDGADGAAGADGADGLTVTQNFYVSNDGTSAYVIDGSNNPTLTLVRGRTYFFTVNASGHPFWIQTTGAGYVAEDAYDTGVTNNGDDVGGIQFTVDLTAPNTLYYQCQFHSAMVGTINIIG